MRTQFILILIAFLFSCGEKYDLPNHVPGVVKVSKGKVYVTYGEGGLIIYDDETQNLVAQIFPPQGMHSIDDVAIDNDLIFVLDSRGHDFMAVFSLKDEKIKLVFAATRVQGGPFNGISASNGNLVISGGTFFLERFTYSNDGKIEGSVSFGRDRGHPDIHLSEDGDHAFVSTDFSLEANPRFGVLSLQIGNSLSIPTVVSELGIEGAGFTEGLTTPIGFPIKSATTNDRLIVAHGNGLTFIPISEGIFGSSYHLDIGINCTAVAVSEEIVYAVGLKDNVPFLVQVNLSNANNPIIISSEALLSEEIPTSIAIGENTLYVAVGSDGLIEILK
ncbi:MAG: hypothetical protein AB8B73_04385 [Ekhidna sp.]